MSASFSFNKDFVTHLNRFDITIKHSNGLINVSDIEVDQTKIQKEILEDKNEIFSIKFHNGELRVITNSVNNNNILVETVTYFKDSESIKNFRDFLIKIIQSFHEVN